MFDLRFAAPNSMAFSYDGLFGQTYFIETASNLTSTGWVALETNTGNGSRVSFTNSTQGAKEGFYRLRTQ